MNRQKQFCNIFVYAKIFVKIHEKACVCIVVDYADMVSAWSLDASTLCQRRGWLFGYRVSIVNNNANTVLVYSFVDYAEMYQRSLRLRRHTVIYFTLEKEKTKDKS